MPWIIDDVTDKIESALGMEQLTSIEITSFWCKSWVANELLDVLTCYDIPENGLNKFKIDNMKECEPIEEEIITRLAKMCPQLSYLQLSDMYELSEAGRL